MCGVNITPVSENNHHKPDCTRRDFMIALLNKSAEMVSLFESRMKLGHHARNKMSCALMCKSLSNDTNSFPFDCINIHGHVLHLFDEGENWSLVGSCSLWQGNPRKGSEQVLLYCYFIFSQREHWRESHRHTHEILSKVKRRTRARYFWRILALQFMTSNHSFLSPHTNRQLLAWYISKRAANLLLSSFNRNQ